jgi:hypothetical protein
MRPRTIVLEAFHLFLVLLGSLFSLHCKVLSSNKCSFSPSERVSPLWFLVEEAGVRRLGPRTGLRRPPRHQGVDGMSFAHEPHGSKCQTFHEKQRQSGDEIQAAAPGGIDGADGLANTKSFWPRTPHRYSCRTSPGGKKRDIVNILRLLKNDGESNARKRRGEP